jgi:hypothetical protein
MTAVVSIKRTRTVLSDGGQLMEPPLLVVTDEVAIVYLGVGY